MEPKPGISIRSTRALPAPERFQYWADVVTQTFVPLECDAPDRRSFGGHVRHRQIGSIGITDVQASAMRARRTTATIARAPSDDLIVVLHLRGTCQTGQRAVAAEINPNEGAVVTTDETYFFEFPTQFRQLVLKLPQHLLAEKRIRSELGHSLLLAPGPAKLMQTLALSCLDDPIAVSADETQGIEQAFADLLRSAIRYAGGVAAHDNTSARYQEACLFIRRNLTDSNLNPAVVAAHVNTSTRTLARTFARAGTTIERVIWHERLAAARRDFLDPRLSDRSITDVAFSWGFNDAAHFSRSFSKAYGVAPSEFRIGHARHPLRGKAE
jgi:AraC-like DNA-binding protein